MLKNVMMVVLTLAKVEGFSSKFVSLYIDPEFEIRFRFFFGQGLDSIHLN